MSSRILARSKSVSVVASLMLVAAVAPVARAQFIGRVIQGATSATSTSIPPDTMGAVGIDEFVQPLNGRYTVYRKADGASVTTSTLTSFWQTRGLTLAGGRAFDPRVVYDPNSRRFILAAIDGLSSAGNNSLLLTSTVGPNTGAGYTPALQVPVNASLFADFDMLGLNGTHVTVGFNMFVPSSSFAASAVYSLPKSSLFAGTTANAGLFNNLDANVTGSTPQPAFDYTGATGVQHVFTDYDTNELAITTVNTAGPTPTVGATARRTVPTYNTQPKARQPTVVSPLLDSGDTRFSGNVVRIGSNYWLVHGIAGSFGNNTAMRWYRVDANTLDVLENGTIEDASYDFIYPSIAVNPQGNVVLGFTRTGTPADGVPSAYALTGTFTGGSTTAGTTTFGTPTLLRAGAATYVQTFGTTRNRWGDYSATMLDPTDPGIFWTSQEYAASGTTWGTVHAELITPAPGEARWSNNATGSYNTAGSWLSGATPLASDTVVFSRPTVQAYSVNLPASQVDAARFSMRQGSVNFALVAGSVINLTATGTAASTASLVVGEFGGAPTSTFTGGVLRTVTTLIAPSPLSDGNMTVTGSNQWTNTASATLGTTASPAGGVSGPLGRANLTISSGASALISGALVVNANGTVLMNSVTSRLTTGSLTNNGVVTLSSGTSSLGPVVNTGTFSSSGTTTTGAVSNTRSLLVPGGTMSAGPITGAGTTSVTGTLSTPSINQATLSVNAGGTANLTGSPSATSVVTTLSVTNNGAALGSRVYSGRLNLTDRDLIVRSGSYADLFDAIRAFRTGGASPGNGIGSTLTSAVTALGVFSNQIALGSSATYYTSYDGIALTASDIIIKYTWVGDTNVDGILDGQDLTTIIEGASLGLTGWQNGDVNYDGVINGLDVSAYTTAFAAYSGPLGPEPAPLGGVPEPTSMALLLVGAFPLRRARR